MPTSPEGLSFARGPLDTGARGADPAHLRAHAARLVAQVWPGDALQAARMLAEAATEIDRLRALLGERDGA
jgi:hypothetical protein